MRLNVVGQAAQAAPELKKLKETSQKLEAAFVKQLLEQMQKGTKPFGEGPGSDIYLDFFNQAVAEAVAARGGMGLADLVNRQMTPRLVHATRKENTPQ